MKPKVLFIMHMPPPVHGAAMMGQYIHDSKVINDTFDCRYFNLTLAKNLEDIGKGGIGKLCSFIAQLAKIRKEAKEFKPDLCYVTPNAKGGAFYKDFVIVMLLKLMHRKIVVHYHNKGVAARQDKAFDNFLYKRFFKGIKVILLADALYDDVKKYVDRKDVFICPNGIPETRSETLPAARNNKIPHILFLSNLLISKGVLVLLDACKILRDRGYSFVCDFVGGETNEMNAEQFRKAAIERSIEKTAAYHGKRYGKEKEVYLNHADIFAFPTYYETFGLVNLEAMEYKLPIVSTDEGGIKDIVKDGENGFIVPPKDSISLADSIEKLFKDGELRQRMGENGYEKFKERFTLSCFERNLTDIVNKCYIWGGKI